MENYTSEGDVEFGGDLILALNETKELDRPVRRLLRGLFTSVKDIVMWRLNDEVSAIWSLSGGRHFGPNETAYAVMITEAQKSGKGIVPPVPAGFTILVNNEEREAVLSEAEEDGVSGISGSVMDVLYLNLDMKGELD